MSRQATATSALNVLELGLNPANLRQRISNAPSSSTATDWWRRPGD